MSDAQKSSANSARVQEIFLAALEKPEARERVAYLEAACAGDAVLRRSVEELLREQEHIGSFLEEPAMSGARDSAHGVGPNGTALLATITEKPGDRIGRYKLLQMIGEGGCGVVYMAEQEEPVRRRVALKVIKLGMDTKSVIARFEAERQALAMMDHPNIAKVLDAGATETGRPYFVMELVRGIKITEYCDHNALSTDERLRLFIQVCQAIQHAHQKGIIHRDVKPSNIVVTSHDGVPVPKVIDFGIAKATEQRLTEKTLFTEFHSFIGTPAYTSPEQAEMSGLDIDTRSDIYSLGVLLYELLTGQTPFDPHRLFQSGLYEMRRIIREEEPVRPSTRLHTLGMAEVTAITRTRQARLPALIQSVRGDLDWIVMKCLEKDRTRRYATANALATDIQCCLAGEAVSARPPSNLYRFQKFVRRHRGPIAAAAAIAAALVAGTVISVWLAVRATVAEHQAVKSRQQEAELRGVAEQEWARAEHEKSWARLNEYVADINLAKQSLDAGNYGRAAQLLDRHRPEDGEPDLRGFEWRYLWQVCQGDEHIALPNQGAPVQSLGFSPDGRWLAIGLSDKVNIFDAPTRAAAGKISHGAISMAFLPDGKTLVTAGGASRDQRRGPGGFGGPPASTVRIWSTGDWIERTNLARSIAPIALSHDGTRLAAVAESQRGWLTGREGVRIFAASNWAELRFLTNASGLIALSSDGRLLVAESRAGVTIWPLDGAGAPVVLDRATNLFAGGSTGFRARAVGALAFSPDGKRVIATRNTLSERGVFVLGIWDARTGADIGTMPEDPEHIEHTGAIACLAVSPDGRWLATASMDYSIRLWDFETRQRVAIFQGHLSEVWALSFSPDGKSLVSGAKDGSVKWWPVRSQQTEDGVPGQFQPPLVVSKDGRFLAAQRQGAMVFIELATRDVVREVPLVSGPFDRGRFGVPLAVALSDDLNVMAQSLDDGRVLIGNTQTMTTNFLRVSERPVSVLALAPDGRSLVTGGFGHTLRWWDLAHGTNTPLDSEASRVLFSSDGRTLAAFQRDNSVDLWDTAALTLRTNIVIDAELRADGAAAFSPDGRSLAVVCVDDTVQLWDTTAGLLIGTFTGHKQGVSSVAFAPDGKTLATASDDSTLKLWNVATQQELLTIRRLGGALRTLVFSPDGRLLVGRRSTSASTGGLRFYPAPLVMESSATNRVQKVAR